MSITRTAKDNGGLRGTCPLPLLGRHPSHLQSGRRRKSWSLAPTAEDRGVQNPWTSSAISEDMRTQGTDFNHRTETGTDQLTGFNPVVNSTTLTSSSNL